MRKTYGRATDVAGIAGGYCRGPAETLTHCTCDQCKSDYAGTLGCGNILTSSAQFADFAGRITRTTGEIYTTPGTRLSRIVTRRCSGRRRAIPDSRKFLCPCIGDLYKQSIYFAWLDFR